LGNLAASDPSARDLQQLKANPRQYLLDSTRECVQLFMNRMFVLPAKKVDIGTLPGAVVELPEPNTQIPRGQPIPKPKPPTRWEKFAAEKGIKKHKKQRMEFDDQKDGELRPRWGYKRANNISDEWVVEHNPGEEMADPSWVDPFTKKTQEKKERVTKQTMRTARNREEAAEMRKSINIARQSTISMGKFDAVLPNEKPHKERQKFQPVINPAEKKKSLKVLDKILGEEGAINSTQVANKIIREDQQQRSMQERKPQKRRRK